MTDETSFQSGPAGWGGNLDPVLHRIAELATGTSSLRVLPAGGRLALALPSDCKAAETVIDLYRPQRWKGRVFRLLSRMLVVSGVASRRPTFAGRSIEPAAAWLRSAAKSGTVGFLGCNPVHGWRCVLAGVIPEDSSQFVAKLGLGEGAAGLRRESEILNAIHETHPGVVRPISLDGPAGAVEHGDDWALLRLDHLPGGSPGSMGDPNVAHLLDGWLDDKNTRLGDHAWSKGLLGRIPAGAAPDGWHERMHSHTIRRALVHGDFAVWNLRAVEGGLCAIDWEWAVKSGIAGIDLVHGLRQEAVMVRGLKPDDAVEWMMRQAGGPVWAAYLEAAGWAGDLRDCLRMGLLHSHFHTKNDSKELLKVLGIKTPIEA
jgi:hypothetical protein